MPGLFQSTETANASPRSLPLHLGQARHVTGQSVDFEVDPITHLGCPPSRDLLGVRNDIHAETGLIDLIDR